MKKTRDIKGRFIIKYPIIKGSKKCSICKNFCPIEKFPYLNKNNPKSVHKIGLRSTRCKDCFNKYRKTTWRKKSKNKIKEKKYRELNKDKLGILSKLWKLKNKDRYKRTTNSRAKIRRAQDPQFKIRSNISRRINHALNAQIKNKKTIKTIDLLGCSVEKLIIHLQNKFIRGMTWKNYGKWEIDHIIPCAKFNLNNLSEQKKCFNFKNLQPLWKLDNIKKSDKIGK